MKKARNNRKKAYRTHATRRVAERLKVEHPGQFVRLLEDEIRAGNYTEFGPPDERGREVGYVWIGSENDSFEERCTYTVVWDTRANCIVTVFERPMRSEEDTD